MEFLWAGLGILYIIWAGLGVLYIVLVITLSGAVGAVLRRLGQGDWGL